MTTPEITQADREAAHSWIQDAKLAVKMALDDPRELYAAFALHRTQARDAALEESAKVAEQIGQDAASAWEDWHDMFDQGRSCGADQAATQIRRLISEGQNG